MDDTQLNNLLERSYLKFDQRRNGYGDWQGNSQPEMDAYKNEIFEIIGKLSLEVKKLKTKYISAFPGTGKSHCFRNFGERVSDSDSSNFPKDNFPQNYIEHLNALNGIKEFCFVSFHKVVWDALLKEGLDFIVVIPKNECKEEYMQRYRDRGSPQSFIDLIDKNWRDWILEIHEDENLQGRVYVLGKNEYLTDFIMVMS